MTRIVALLLSLSLSAAAGAEIYKWTDPQGQVHYGEKPGGKGAASITLPAAPPPAAAPPDARQRLENIRKWGDARHRERLAEQRRKAEQKKRKAELERRCLRLKNDLADMQQGRIAWYRVDEAGQRHFYSDQEVEGRKAALRRDIERNCR